MNISTGGNLPCNRNDLYCKMIHVHSSQLTFTEHCNQLRLLPERYNIDSMNEKETKYHYTISRPKGTWIIIYRLLGLPRRMGALKHNLHVATELMP